MLTAPGPQRKARSKSSEPEPSRANCHSLTARPPAHHSHMSIHMVTPTTLCAGPAGAPHSNAMPYMQGYVSLTPWPLGAQSPQVHHHQAPPRLAACRHWPRALLQQPSLCVVDGIRYWSRHCHDCYRCLRRNHCQGVCELVRGQLTTRELLVCQRPPHHPRPFQRSRVLPCGATATHAIGAREQGSRSGALRKV
jgi:hypothetical protein